MHTFVIEWSAPAQPKLRYFLNVVELFDDGLSSRKVVNLKISSGQGHQAVACNSDVPFRVLPDRDDPLPLQTYMYGKHNFSLAVSQELKTIQQVYVYY